MQISRFCDRYFESDLQKSGKFQRRIRDEPRAIRDAVEPDPKKAIRAQPSHAFRSVVAEHAHLVPQGDDLEIQRGTAVKAEGEQGEAAAEIAILLTMLRDWP